MLPHSISRLCGLILLVLVTTSRLWGQGGAAVAPAPSTPILTIPFELASNKIYIETKVNGQGPYPFVLDTGAPFSVIDWDLAEKLGIKVFRTGEIGGAGHGTVKLGSTVGVGLSMHGLRYRPSRMESIPLNSTLSLAEGRDVQGLIGADVLERFVSEYNFADNVLLLYSPQNYTYGGKGQRIPISVQGHVLARATVTVEGRAPISGRFVIDTGARLAVALNTHVVEEHELNAADIKQIRTTVGWGLGGPLDHGLTRAQSLQLGGVVFKSPVITLADDSRGIFASRSITGVIGNEVLKRCTMVLDLRREQLILEPNEGAMSKPFPADCSGLFVTAGGEGYSEFTVRTVVKESPASEANLMPGDVIRVVDGSPAPTLEKLRELFRVPGKSYEIEVKREGKISKTVLKTRELI